MKLKIKIEVMLSRKRLFEIATEVSVYFLIVLAGAIVEILLSETPSFLV